MNLQNIILLFGRKLISMMSDEQLRYLKKKKERKKIIIFFQIMIIVLLFLLWQALAEFNVINTFLFSSPKNIFKTITSFDKNVLIRHILVTFNETMISFLIASILGLIISSFLWFNEIVAKIFDPYLTIINSLPKVSLGPLIIIWCGAGFNSIIFMALMISLFLSIINLYNAFISTDSSYITLLKSFNASKKQIFFKVILPANKVNIFNTFKINISMSLIGVIMGELLVSKEGLGYLIMYGSQVFNINLVITSVFILGIMSYLIYFVLMKIEKKLKQ
ncbi:MAG: ABC transporter permease [Bacilli bacterium]|nr:ABC transporter permease [Bacilli bacterium]